MLCCPPCRRALDRAGNGAGGGIGDQRSGATELRFRVCDFPVSNPVSVSFAQFFNPHASIPRPPCVTVLSLDGMLPCATSCLISPRPRGSAKSARRGILGQFSGENRVQNGGQNQPGKRASAADLGSSASDRLRPPVRAEVMETAAPPLASHHVETFRWNVSLHETARRAVRTS
jgi:hypothetical protein